MTAQELLDLHKALQTLREEIDLSPDRHTQTAKGYLADSDWTTLLTAGSIVHRLYLCKEYPSVSQESYFAPEPVVRDPAAWQAVARIIR